MTKYPGKFIVLDGIAGSGKSTLLRQAKELLSAKGKKIFDLAEWTETNQRPPLFEEISDYDIYFTFEPTKSWLGRAIRDEISFHPETYSGATQATAFALDRLIEYRRLIIPALMAGKIIIQDRSITTSIVYQSNIDDTIDTKGVLALPGNIVALEYAPTDLILTYIDPAVAISRRTVRQDQDKGMYAEQERLNRFQEIFHSSSFHDLMSGYGTRIHTFDTSGELEDTTRQFSQLLSNILSI